MTSIYIQYSGDLPQGGLEIPCLLTFRGDKKEVMKVRKLLGMKLQVPESNVSSPSKKRKLDVCIIESSMPETQVINRPWLSLNKIELSFADKELIIAGDELTDIHMNFAQAVLKKQFPELSGLHSTLLLPRCSITGTDAVQILHCRGNHWSVVTSIGCPAGVVKVYDSLYTSVDQVTLRLISTLFGSDTQVKVEVGPKQLGVKDCGLFAIATATLLASGGDPTSVTFNQLAMRQHLMKSFDDSCLKPFPQN